MKLFRLVHQDYDPVTTGSRLTRCSTQSHMKLGEGMYFAASLQSAQDFADTGNHTYTHVLECEIEGVEEHDFADMVTQPNLIKRQGGESLPQAVARDCQENNLLGVKWQSKKGWIEYCLLSNNVDDRVLVVRSIQVHVDSVLTERQQRPLKSVRRMANPSVVKQSKSGDDVTMIDDESASKRKG